MAPKPQTLQWQQFASAGEMGVRVVRHERHGETGIHDHTFREIVYVESGTAAHITAEAPRRLRPGDLLIIRPLVWHAYRSPRDLVLINCLIDQDLMRVMLNLMDDVEGAFELFRRPVHRNRRSVPVVLHARPAQRPGLLEPLRRIMNEQRERASGWRAACAAALLELLVTTVRLNSRQLDVPRATIGGRTDLAVVDTVAYLESHFSDPVHLNEAAARVGLSPAYLSRSFSRRMGIGMVEFVHQLRCEEACRLLRSTSLSVSAIASRVGYDEIAYFSRCFRQQTSRSPRQYRQMAHDGK